MKNTVRKLLKITGESLGLRKPFRYFQELLQEPALADLPADKVFGSFTDSYGNEIELLASLRDRLKPGWQAMLCPASQASAAIPSTKQLAQDFRVRRDQLGHMEGFLRRPFSFSFADKEVLEIGTYNGATAYALAEAGAKSVVGTDIAAYYILQTPDGVVSEDAIATKNSDLARLRDAYGKIVGKKTCGHVSFLEDDIQSSSLPSEAVDVVVSLGVLEHLTNPQEGFRQIARILKPGGVAFHEYNPFFAINGGHSLCTLDFLWGHTRLHAADFERYLDEIRPKEKEVALSFYRNNLNRMTFSELEHQVEQAGLTLLSLLPWYSKNDLSLVTPHVLGQCKHVYPSAELADLIAPTVWVLLRRD